MDPYTEQRLREEVMYLHSLWHKGPPQYTNPNITANSNPSNFLHRSPNPTRNSNPTNFFHRSLNPSRNSNPTNFLHRTPNPSRNSNRTDQLKTMKKKMKKKKGKKLPPSSEFEWPCNQVAEPTSSSSGWPIFNPAKIKPVRLPTAQELTVFDAIQIHQNALKVSKEFFTENEDSDGCIDSDDDNDDDDTMDEDGNAQYNFFVKVFEEDGELRGYYEKNNENGEFSCLVCVGIGQKVGKRFKNCVSLVQHSLTIARTKKKKAHRAYSQVVCKVLGWDINKLPSMPLPSDKQHVDSEGNAEVASDSLTCNDKISALDNANLRNSDVNEDEELPSSVIPETSTGDNVKENDVGQLVDVDNCIIPGITDNADGDMMLCESFARIDDADTCIEKFECGVSNTDGNSSGVVNHLECSKDVDAGKEIENIQKEIVVNQTENWKK